MGRRGKKGQSQQTRQTGRSLPIASLAFAAPRFVEGSSVAAEPTVVG